MYMNKRFILILTSLLLGLTAMAQTGTGGVMAKVVSRSGRVPVSGAEIVVSAAGEQVAKTVSSDEGNFVIEELPDGDYLLTVTAGGFATGMVRWKVMSETLFSYPFFRSRLP